MEGRECNMSNYYSAPNVSTVGKEINSDSARDYFKQLLNKSYNRHTLTTDDAIAIASLASAIDEFLTGDETERRAALTLRKNLHQIVRDSLWEKEKSGSQKNETKNSLSTLYTSDGKIAYLGTLLGSGGEGSVYKIPNMPGKVAKIFKATTRTEYMERKIEAIISNHIPSRLENILISTVPETLLYDETDRFVGYVMPWIPTKFKLYDVTRDSSTRKKYFPELDYKGLIIIAYNLAEVVNCLHEHAVVVGDLNYHNIVVNPDGTVCLIDTDSYDIVDKKTSEHFPCVVGVQEMLAPELQTVSYLKDGEFSKETDLFSLAILIFRLLMSNADPFGGILTTNISASEIAANDSIINGECPYVREIEGKKVPDWAPSFDILPKYIQELFIRVFDYTFDTYRTQIGKRPTAKEWMEALMRYYNEPLKRCEADLFHWYRPDLVECPFYSKIDIPLPAKRSDTKKSGLIEHSKGIITVEI